MHINYIDISEMYAMIEDTDADICFISLLSIFLCSQISMNFCSMGF